MHELDRQHEFTGDLWRDIPLGSLDIVIIADNNENDIPEHEPVADTSFLPAPDERGGDLASGMGADDIKKPPTDPPKVFQGTPEEGSEDDEGITAAPSALGELASAKEVAELPAPPEELPSHLERITRSTHNLVVNRAHPNQELVDDALGTLETGRPWTELADQGSYLNSRKYFVDDPEHPSFMAKYTDYAQEEVDRTPAEVTTEMAQAPEVRAIVDSDAAQQIAQEQGFAGISFVESVVTVEGPGAEERTIVYPWQDGTVHGGEEGRHGATGGSVPGSEVEALSTVVDRINGLFAVNGIASRDLGNEQIIVADDGMLHLIDTEGYTKFTPPEPVLAPNEQLTMTAQEWSPTTDALPEITVGHDELVVARGSETVSPQLTSNTGENGTVIALWSSFTREASMTNVQDRDLATQQLQDLERTVPALMQPGVIAHVVGRASINPEDGHKFMEDADLALKIKSSQRSGVHIDEPTTVRLDTKTGKIETFNERGEQTYSYTPPTVIDDM